MVHWVLPYLCVLVVTMGFLLLGGAPAADPVDLIRRGNAAFELERYEQALELYEQAEGLAPDPGLVSFNKAAALYRLERYREAEIYYRLSRHDAEGERLPRVLYDLGNALLKESRDRDAKLIAQAIAAYEQCLKQQSAPPELVEDAKHNLRLAKVLLQKAKNAKNPPLPNEQDSNPRPRSEDSGTDLEDARVGSESGPLDLRDGGQPRRRLRPGDPGYGDAQSNQPREGGMGNLPPIPDEDKLVPLSAEDTAAYVKKTADRILEERRKFHLMSTPRPSANIKDW